ncbi:MAG: photosynthetic complex assembly protein PuhC [Pseudomonadota bacterium]
MSELHENPAPTVPLILAAGLVVVSLLGVSWQKWVITPSAQTAQVAREIIQQRTLQFEDADAGGVMVLDAESREVIDLVEAGEGGFLRGTLRGLVRERKLSTAELSTADRAPGFQLTHFSDGTVILTDLATGREIDLRAFGAINADNFLRYLTPTRMVTREGG